MGTSILRACHSSGRHRSCIHKDSSLTAVRTECLFLFHTHPLRRWWGCLHPVALLPGAAFPVVESPPPPFLLPLWDGSFPAARRGMGTISLRAARVLSLSLKCGFLCLAEGAAGHFVGLVCRLVGVTVEKQEKLKL